MTTGGRYVVGNPFPGHFVIPIVQVYDAVQAKWADPGWNGFNGNDPAGSRGVRVSQVGDDLVVITGGTAVVGTSQDGNPFTPVNWRTSAPCRVLVWRVNGPV